MRYDAGPSQLSPTVTRARRDSARSRRPWIGPTARSPGASLLGEVKLPLALKKADLEEYLGKPVFLDEQILRELEARHGGWPRLDTPAAAPCSRIEAVANPGKEGFRLTGKLGEVMQESANIAYTWVRHIAGRFDVPAEFWERNSIHLHVPAGATPRTGRRRASPSPRRCFPSCGARPCPGHRHDGRASLVGRVLPIGGLKEKVIAARRNRLKTLIIPEGNRRDLEEIPEHVREGLTFHLVSTMDEVIERIF